MKFLTIKFLFIFLLLNFDKCSETRIEIYCNSEKNCESGFLSFLHEQTRIIQHKEKLLNQEDIMPGFGMYYGTGQEKATIEFITLRNYHTEMNYLFFDLLEKLKNMINSKQKRSKIIRRKAPQI